MPIPKVPIVTRAPQETPRSGEPASRKRVLGDARDTNLTTAMKAPKSHERRDHHVESVPAMIRIPEG
jgi:hypothetical protein